MLTNSMIGTGYTGILTVPADTEYIATVMFLCNTSDSINDIIDVHLVPAGGTPVTSNKILSNLLVQAGDTFTLESEKVALGAGDKIVAKSSSAMVALTVSYIKV